MPRIHSPKSNFKIRQELPCYLEKLDEHTAASEEDRPLVADLMGGKQTDPVEVRMPDAYGRVSYCVLALPQADAEEKPGHASDSNTVKHYLDILKNTMSIRH